MKKALRHRNQPIIFRQWSRKNYAIFSSLGKEVNIGQVDIEICDKAVSKSSKTEITLNQKSDLLQLENDDEDVSFLDNTDIEKLTLLSVISNVDDSSWHSRTFTHTHLKNYLSAPFLGARITI